MLRNRGGGGGGGVVGVRGEMSWPPLAESLRCLSEACLLPSQRRKSRKC